MGDFNTVELLKSDAIFEELKRRIKINEELLERICSFTRTTQVWFVLWQNGPMYKIELTKCGFPYQTVKWAIDRLEKIDLVTKKLAGGGWKYSVQTPDWWNE